MPAWEAGAGVSKSGSPTPRSSTSSPAAFRRLASLLMATVSDALRCCTLIDNGSGIQRFHDGGDVRKRPGKTLAHGLAMSTAARLAWCSSDVQLSRRRTLALLRRTSHPASHRPSSRPARVDTRYAG